MLVSSFLELTNHPIKHQPKEIVASLSDYPSIRPRVRCLLLLGNIALESAGLRSRGFDTPHG
jgi:hypothetical protein